MANNRMYLLHRPSMIGVYIGKNMGAGWYDPPEREKIALFYEEIEWLGDQEDIVVIAEHGPGITNWIWVVDEELSEPLMRFAFVGSCKND